MEENSEVIFCRICLRIGLTQKYILSDNQERHFIEKLFKENGYSEELDARSYACFECISVLHRSYNFIQKALKAQKVLSDFRDLKLPLTDTLLSDLDRNEHGISSKLACSEPETHVIEPSAIQNPEEYAIKTEPSDSHDNIDPNTGEITNLNDSNNSQYYTDPFTGEVTEIDPTFANHYIDPSGDNHVIKTDPALDEPGNMNDEPANMNDEPYMPEYNYLQDFAKDCDELVKKKRGRPKGKKNKKKEKRKVKKRKVPLNVFSSDERNVKKRIRLPDVSKPDVSNIVEKRFRARKNINYAGLDDNRWKNTPIERDDDEFVPKGEDQVDESSEESDDNYDDNGKVIKRKEDTRVFPMQCEECDSIITSKPEHHYHYMQMHRDKEYPYKRNNKCLLCPHCGESVSKTQLKLHEERHLGKTTSCDVCQQSYSTRKKMLEHKRRLHATERPWHECDYCGKAFFMKSELKLHIRTHTGEKPFKCDLCTYRAAHKGNITVHVRQYHQLLTTTGKPRKRIPKVNGKSEKVDKRKSSKKSKKKNGDKVRNKTVEESALVQDFVCPSQLLESCELLNL